jgi:hypothetical protein
VFTRPLNVRGSNLRDMNLADIVSTGIEDSRCRRLR